MILAKKNFDKNSILFTNLIFAFFPISFILGNLITNINLLLFCCFGIFHLKSKILSIKYDLIIKIIFWFFIIVFFSTVLSFLKSLYFDEYEHINSTQALYPPAPLGPQAVKRVELGCYLLGMGFSFSVLLGSSSLLVCSQLRLIGHQ